MAVTKRTRFEVLRRDNHACRYCGAAAPDVKLTVDHVTPVALGGSDDPSNLVAACRDCNAGKSSTTPDATLVADVREDALRFAELTRQAYDVLAGQVYDRMEYVDAFVEEWGGVPVPGDWRATIGRWHRMGVPVEIVTEAAQIAMNNTTVYDRNRFSYMCGIVWNQVRTITEEVAQKAVLDGAWMTGEALSNERIEAYETGYAAGDKATIAWFCDIYAGALYGGTILEAHIDNRMDSIPAGVKGVA